MIKLTSDDLNTLIHNYFVEENYPQALEAFKKEVSVILNIKYSLIDLVYYGAKYIYIKQHVHKTGCREMFCLSQDHHCKFSGLEDADGEDSAGRSSGQRFEGVEEGTNKRKGGTLVHEKGLLEDKGDERSRRALTSSDKSHAGKKQTDENRALFEQIKNIFKLSQRKKEGGHDARSNDSECERGSRIEGEECVKRRDKSIRGACDVVRVQDRRPFEGEADGEAPHKPMHALSTNIGNTLSHRSGCAKATAESSVADVSPYEARSMDTGSHYGGTAQDARARDISTGGAWHGSQYQIEYDVLELGEHFSRTGLCAWNNSKLLATAGSDGQLRVFLGQCILRKDVQSEITALDFQGSVVACGSYNGGVAVFDVKTQRELHLRNFRGRVNVVRAESAGVIAGSDDGCISVGNKTHQCGLGKVFDVELIKDSIAVATESGIVRIVSAPGSAALSVADEKYGAMPGASRYVGEYTHYERAAMPSPGVHDIKGGEGARRSSSRFTDLVGHQGSVNSIRHHGSYLASASEDATVKIWNLKNMREERSFNHGGEVFRVQIRNEKIYSCSSDGTLRVWSFDRQINAFSHEGGVFTFDKKTLVVSGSTDHTVRVWDERVGEVMRHQTKGPVYTVSFSHDERLVCVCSENESPVVLDLRRV